jgi:gliotoxin/aspirochlorine biosynthesis O-methyltransferase
MENTLIHLVASLQSTLGVLKGRSKGELVATLHKHDKLPDKKMAGLASQAVDLLHETEQLLEPGPLVLADHFLGIYPILCTAMFLSKTD